jgi:hypothetical protein
MVRPTLPAPNFSDLLSRQEQYDALMNKVWDELRVLVPLETRCVVLDIYIFSLDTQ